MTHLSLFSGIGGIDVAAEWAGFRTVGQCEIDPYCRRILERHWPKVPRWEDIREMTGAEIRKGCGAITLISGGFPCQDVSQANQYAQQGMAGKRSGLWSQMARIICEVRPGWVLVENVAALLGGGLGRVLGDLAEIGYDAEWDCLSAWQVGAPHARKRLFVVAYPDGQRLDKATVFVGTDPPCTKTTHYWQKTKHDERRLPDQIFGYRLPPPPSDLRVDDGPAPWMDRIRAIGNAVVPHQVYPVLQAIADVEARDVE